MIKPMKQMKNHKTSRLRLFCSALMAVFFLMSSVSAPTALASASDQKHNCTQMQDHKEISSVAHEDDCCNISPASENIHANGHNMAQGMKQDMGQNKGQDCGTECLDQCLGAPVIAFGPDMKIQAPLSEFSRLSLLSDTVASRALDVEISPPQA